MKGLADHDCALPSNARKAPQTRFNKRSAVLVLLLGCAALGLARRYLSLKGPLETQGKGPFHWKQCQADDPHYLCGYLTVPLDYTNASDGRTVQIATTMYQPVPGLKSGKTLVIEPGGPGGSGTEYVWRRAATFSEWYTGGQYDVLGFDPRGVNLSSPAISCFPNDAYRDRWEWAAQSWPEVRGYRAMEELDARRMNEALMSGCRERLGDLPRFMTTAFVARDVDAIREALGEEHLTAFMVSYGTGIGQTYAQMFPDRVGSIALDGMECARDGRQPWVWGTTSLDNVTDAFEHGFIAECVEAGHPACALAQQGAISRADGAFEAARSHLSAHVRGLVERVRARAVPGHTSDGPGIVTYEHLVGFLYQTLYRPASWVEAATVLRELEGGNATAALEKSRTAWSYDPSRPPTSTPSFPGVYSAADPHSAELMVMVICGDASDHEKQPLDFWKATHAQMLNQSWISATPRLYDTLACRHFDWQAAELYRGDFNRTLAHPILLIGSPYDPATPLRNARRLAAEMGDNARLIVSNGYGHSSGQDPSDCTNSLVRAYITNGTLPKAAESECYANKKPFVEGYSSLWSNAEAVGPSGRWIPV